MIPKKTEKDYRPNTLTIAMRTGPLERRFKLTDRESSKKAIEYVGELKNKGEDYDIWLNGSFIGEWTRIVNTRP